MPNRNTKKINWLGINGNGDFYLKISESDYNARLEAGDKFVKRGENEGKPYYHETFNQDTVAGYLKSIKLKDSDYGKQLQIQVDGGDEIDVVTFPLFYLTTKDLSRYAVHFIRCLPVLDFTRKLSLIPNKEKRKGTDGKYYLKYPQLNILYKDGKEPYFIEYKTILQYKKDGGVVPNWKEKEVETIDGKKEVETDKTAANTFLYKVLTEHIEKIKKYWSQELSNADDKAEDEVKKEITTKRKTSITPKQKKEGVIYQDEIETEVNEDIGKSIDMDDLPF